MYFYLKEPNSDKETIILLKYYVSNSKKYFQISTKLSINPNNWNFKSRSPIIKRGLASVESRQLTHQLNKLDELLQSTINKHGAYLIKEHLTEVFKPKKNIADKHLPPLDNEWGAYYEKFDVSNYQGLAQLVTKLGYAVPTGSLEYLNEQEKTDFVEL